MVCTVVSLHTVLLILALENGEIAASQTSRISEAKSILNNANSVQFCSSHLHCYFVIDGTRVYLAGQELDVSELNLRRGYREIIETSGSFFGPVFVLVGPPRSCTVERNFNQLFRLVLSSTYTDMQVITV